MADEVTVCVFCFPKTHGLWYDMGRQEEETLGISGVAVEVYAWRQQGTAPEHPGVQIDLLLDRKDGIINLCEMKYTSGEYTLDNAELERLINRRETFRTACGIRKSIHLTLACITINTAAMSRAN